MEQVRSLWSRPLALASAVLTGVLAGGMVLIQVVLVPFWRATPPAEFRRWFAANVDRLRRLMVPLGAAAGAVSVASAVPRLSGRRDHDVPSVVAAVATGGVIAITLAVNEPANHRFTEGPLTDSETRGLLRTWARWHSVRVVLGLVAAAAATTAVVSRSAS
jgi:negative regulator of sigma E activity